MEQIEPRAIHQRRVPALFAGLVAAVFIIRLIFELWVGTGDRVDWVPLAMADSVALASKKPILYDFTAAWCSPCQIMEREVYRSGELANYINNRYVPVKIEDRVQEDGRNSAAVEVLQKRFSVDSFPTVVVVSPDGILVYGKQAGYPGKAKFEEFLKKK